MGLTRHLGDTRAEKIVGGIILSVILGALLWLMVAYVRSGAASENRPTTRNQVRTEECEKRWANSADRKIGAPKDTFMDRCKADLKELERTFGQ